MVRFPSTDPFSRRFQELQDDDHHEEENQNYHHHHQENFIPTARYHVKENDQKAAVEPQDQQHVSLCSICKRNDKVLTDTESGEIICSNCGMVISDKIQQINKLEWRTFNTEQADDNNNNNNRIRTGAPTSIARHDMGLSTVIG